ncbi:MAG: hypothetical protein NW215_09960 [Hyphomicrobiales bacterium]|nr:hypothetical protein [Hyphomicrobiales bacterium]
MQRFFPAFLTVFAACALPAASLAAEVTLRSRTGEISVRGELAASDERTFIIKSDKFGVMMLETAKFECVGEACPRNRSEEFFSVRGSNTIGAQLMPAIIESFAAKAGANVEKRVGADAEEIEMQLKTPDGKSFAVIDLQSHGSAHRRRTSPPRRRRSACRRGPLSQRRRRRSPTRG